MIKQTRTGLFALLAASLSLAAAPLPTAAADKTIGVIMTANVPYYREMHKAFVDGLPEEGLSAPKYEIVMQSPNADPMAWTNAARKLVAIGSSVIVAYGAPATLSVLHETGDIPVIFAGVPDPKALGLIGKNATGVSSRIPVAGLIKNFRSIVNFSNLGVLYSENEADTLQQVREIKLVEGLLGFKSVGLNLKKNEETSKAAHIDALFLTTGCGDCVTRAVIAARKARIPTATTVGGAAESGVVLTIAANPQEQGREAARLAGRVIKGAAPASLPVEHPKRVDMVINLKEANELGLKIPLDLLTSATRVTR